MCTVHRLDAGMTQRNNKTGDGMAVEKNKAWLDKGVRSVGSWQDSNLFVLDW
jgi:hypothetical protein